MDPIRRKILVTGAAATALAAAPRAFTQQTGQGGAAMSFYERGPVRIHYEEAGSGFPLLLIAGGGLNSTISRLSRGPFDPIEEFKGEYRCIAADLRNATTGQSTGPVEVDRPWESYADDQLGLMDHLGDLIDSHVEFLPAARATVSIFGRRPFTLADNRQTRAVDDEMQACPRWHPPKRAVEVLATTGQRRVIG